MISCCDGCWCKGAHCILRQGAPDSDLKAWGEGRLESSNAKDGKKDKKKGSKKAKKKAVVAVARKLAVLLHRLWVTGEVYDPLYNRKAAEAAKGQGQSSHKDLEGRVGYLRSMRKRRVGVTARSRQNEGSQETGYPQLDYRDGSTP